MCGIDIVSDEIFVFDGLKCDMGNFLDIFGFGNLFVIIDLVYFVYVDINVMVGNMGEVDDEGCYVGIYYLLLIKENKFMLSLLIEKVDLIYFCYFNNLIGIVVICEIF